MSMSYHVVGFRPPDETWQRMKDAYDSCRAAGVPVPREVDSFFEGSTPDSAGVEVRLQATPAVRKWRGDMEEGFEVDVRMLPPGVTIVRFYNSY